MPPTLLARLSLFFCPSVLSFVARRLSFLRTPGDVDNSGAVQAPTASVFAPADLERVPITPHATHPFIGSDVIVVGTYFFLWCVS